MTIDDLTALALRETQRQAALAHQAAHDGGVWDPLLGRFVDWNEDGPISRPSGATAKSPWGLTQPAGEW
uniref:Uncharacterized protein n=1 Tax=viral metagenome TaxID=1070528 RepID=A0A6H1ZZF0_9ZZZZ